MAFFQKYYFINISRAELINCIVLYNITKDTRILIYYYCY